MTIDELLSNLRSQKRAKLDEAGELADGIGRLAARLEAENRKTSGSEAADLARFQARSNEILAEVDQVQERIDELEREKAKDEAADRLAREFHPTGTKSAYDTSERNMTTARAHITSEPRTYSREKSIAGDGRNATVSFFSDLYNYQLRGDYGARDRLERHRSESVAEGELTQRATSTGSFAGLVPPQYLVDQAVLVARASRPFANTCTSMPLPAEGMSLLVPRGTTGASAAVQATENSSVSSTDEVWGNITVPVATIAGQQDVSRQSLERGFPGIDQLIFSDLAGAYGTALDQQCLSGSGTSGQMLGVLNTAGVGQATAFGAAVTVATFYTKIAGQISGITSARFLAPTWLALHPRRAAWLEAQFDSQGRPLVVPGDQGPMNTMGVDPATEYGAGGKLLGLRVVTDASIPTAVGTGPEDQALVYRAQDLMLWEDGDGMPRELRFEQTLGNQLTVKLVAYGYAAFTAARYPTAVGIVGGNAGSAGFGLVAPTF